MYLVDHRVAQKASKSPGGGELEIFTNYKTSYNIIRKIVNKALVS